MTADTCGCCEPGAPLTPVLADNRPALTAVAFRAGTFSSFRQAMLQAIAAAPELRNLRTRLSGDYSITILEMWAVVADVLTFYQERIANEGYLRTARLRDSVLRLARLLDYHLGPGAAATALLAFTLENKATLTVPVGLRVQSVPGEGEKPQKYETLESIAADARLNKLRIVPAPVAENPLAAGMEEALLAPGTVQALAPGNRFVLFDAAEVEELTVAQVRREELGTVLRWSGKVQGAGWSVATQARRFQRTFALFGYNAPATYMEASNPAPSSTFIKWTLKNLTAADYAFGPASVLPLDGRYEGIAVGTDLLVSVDGGAKKKVTVTGVSQTAATFANTAGTVTQVSVFPGVPALGDRRNVRIYELTGAPIQFWGYRWPAAVVPPAVCVRDASGIAIDTGRKILLRDATHDPVSAIISNTYPVAAGTENLLVIELDADAPFTFDTATAVLLGNVALASHGETVADETVGDGDAASGFQKFALQKKPLTYLTTGAPGGVASTLRVLVNRVLWTEVPTLYGQVPDAQVYTVRIEDDGTASVQFGDGRTGARLPSGRGNVLATYRQGTGLAGRVGAGSLKAPLDMPVGLKSVVNPAAASGGADPETLAGARTKAPTTVRTFGRAVSLRDFEDLATASGEVAKAAATWVWNGDQRAVHLTIAGQQAGVFAPDALARIYAGLTAQRDPNHALFLDNFRRVTIVVSATLGVNARRIAPDVKAAAMAALLDGLSFDNLGFAQPIHLSDIFAVLQGVDGVEWVDIDLFHFKDRSPANLAYRGATAAPVQRTLRIYPARPGSGLPPAVTPAEQAWVEAPAADIALATSGGLPA